MRKYTPLAALGAGLCLLGLTACSGSSSSTASGTTAAAGGGSSATAAATAAAVAGGAPGNTADACTLVTAAELSQAVGVQYTAITGSGTLCG